MLNNYAAMHMQYNKYRGDKHRNKSNFYRNKLRRSEGISDPDYCILKFTAENGRYYSHFRSTDFDVDTNDQV